MKSSCRRLATIVTGLPLVLTTACVPVDSSLGGTRPPPTVDGGDTDAGNNPDAVTVTDRTMVFDIIVEASSLAVDGITIGATLTVLTDDDGLSIASVTLRDTVNNFLDTSAATGIAGGVLLTASAEPFGGRSDFALSVADDGSLLAVFSSAAGVPGLFVLQTEGFAFDPGAIGETYQVQTDSSFGFRIDGGVVAGTINLNGVSISGLGTVDVYTGTFTGSLRSP